MTTRAELEKTLTQIPDVDEATVVREQSLVATVVSEAFRDQNEAQRQEAVWKHLRAQLGSNALQNIEFIFDEHSGRERRVGNPLDLFA